jgi:NAD(P)-dependent dehydrogenase (short-subunit alcohol dehydrogenase family)
LKRLLVVGAGGDIGQGIVRAAADSDWRVVAAGRNSERLDRLRETNVAAVSGDLGTEEGAAALWQAACSVWGGLDGVVVTVNAPNQPKPLLQHSTAELRDLFHSNLLTHFIAAKTFIPLLAPDGVYVGIGGGTADFIIPQLTQVSMAQAALRMMYRGVVRENRDGPPIRELMIASMVNGPRTREHAAPSWITDLEVGKHVCAILSEPARFPGPILKLQDREQVARADVEPAVRAQ